MVVLDHLYVIIGYPPPPRDGLPTKNTTSDTVSVNSGKIVARKAKETFERFMLLPTKIVETIKNTSSTQEKRENKIIC